MATEPLFREDPYLDHCEARVTAVTEDGGLVLDRTVFYAAGGGQPGDVGVIESPSGPVPVADTVYGPERIVVHRLGEGATPPPVGANVIARLDWERRFRHMRMHTALHLLSVVLPYPVTGGSIGVEESRLDFDIPEAGLDKEEITQRLQALVAADHAVTTEWISDEELEANPGLVKTMSVKPPMGTGRVRLVRIGDIDLQPCGGTHVARTGEIGPVFVSKIEKKGRINRRVRIRLGEA